VEERVGIPEEDGGGEIATVVNCVVIAAGCDLMSEAMNNLNVSLLSARDCCNRLS